MPSLIAIILICSSQLPHGACNRTSATDVLVSPASNPFDCMMKGQALVAGTALNDTLGSETYMKIVCERPRPDHRRVKAGVLDKE